MLSFIDRELKYAPMIADEARKTTVPPSWAIAIARRESAFKPEALVISASDGKRGGAYGLMQMTLKTARSLGFHGDPEELLSPTLNIYYGVALLAELHASDERLLDVAARYNSGKPYGRAPKVTVNEYVPYVVKWAGLYSPKWDSPVIVA